MTDAEKMPCCTDAQPEPSSSPCCCSDAAAENESSCCCADAPAEGETAEIPTCCRHKDRSPEEYLALVNRLSRIEGQVRGLRNMLDKNVYCADILVQVSAVSAALNGFSRELLGQHIRTCVADDLRAGNTQKLDELLQLLPKLMK